MGIQYRAKQFWWAINAKPLSAEQQKQVEKILSAAEADLFQAYSKNDSQHAVRVLNNLPQSAQQSNSLLKAALLHDIGRSCWQLTVWDRCLIVLASRIFPRQSRSWGEKIDAPQRWRRPFIARQWHAARGAEMAEAANSDRQTVTLIARHQEKPIKGDGVVEQLLATLQEADDKS